MINEYPLIYLDLLSRIIEVEKDLYGELAIKVALRVPGLEISENGKVVKIAGLPGAVMQNLLQEYEALGGTPSKRLNHAVLEVYRKRYPGIDLPKGW